MNRWSARCVGRLVSIVLVAAAAGGCRKAPAPSPDAKALEALAAYQPQAKSDDLGRVVELKLDGPQVDDLALDHVAGLSELKVLSLYGSSVTDDGLEKLKGASKLESLGLGKTAVTRKGLAHLERLPALRWLWVTENKTLAPAQIEDFKKKAVPGVTVYN